ncbi:MAG TPA: 3-isopropylmalate dehydratase small subunit [Candidatus Thermoplasmatota archaeon]|nr:3-isopropylmalate dehydratase small subunit [Candidatus Thermoplasmatota archaeon]
METRFSGKAWVFGDNIDTDQITPGKYLTMITAEELGKVILAGAPGREDFAKHVAKGDVLVAGRNFGCGSSREHAPLAVKGAGMPVVLAESFARIFYRNAINVGLPILEVADISKKVHEGDVLDVDLTTGRIHNKTRNETYEAVPLSDKAMSILRAGGLVEVTREKLRQRGKLAQ